MELTKAAINENKDKIHGLDGYNLVILKIEKNLDINPDIAIEACKSLIEGLCKMALKLISTDYANSNKIRGKCDRDLPYLVEKAFDDVFVNRVESDLNYSLFNIINDQYKYSLIVNKAKSQFKKSSKAVVTKISAIRNERGDISHGKLYPKENESGIYLSRSIAAITDGICSYMIYEFSNQYGLKEKEIRKLNYDNLIEFNLWLDNQNDSLTTKIDFSRLLYQHIYDKYEEIYYSDYQEYLDLFQNETKLPKGIIRKAVTPKKTTIIISKVIEELINTFDESTYWTERRLERLFIFVETEKLIEDKLKALIDDYLFTNKRPFRDKVVESMNEKPSLKDRAVTTEALTEKIIALASELNTLV